MKHLKLRTCLLIVTAGRERWEGVKWGLKRETVTLTALQVGKLVWRPPVHTAGLEVVVCSHNSRIHPALLPCDKRSLGEGGVELMGWVEWVVGLISNCLVDSNHLHPPKCVCKVFQSVKDFNRRRLSILECYHDDPSSAIRPKCSPNWNCVRAQSPINPASGYAECR